jgi:predicted permease
MESDIRKQGMMRFCSIFSNNGFLGIPLAAAVFPNNPVVIMVVITINIITNVMLYTIGVYMVTGNKSYISLKKAFLNPVLIAFVAGVIINLTGITKYVPEVRSFCSHFSGVVIPLSMTILGMKLGEVKVSSLFTDGRTYFVSALKLIACPLIVTAFAFLLKTLSVPVFDNGFIIGVFMSFAMPTAGLASAFADTYEGDSVGAVRYTLNSTILSVVTIPLLYMLLLAVL